MMMAECFCTNNWYWINFKIIVLRTKGDVSNFAFAAMIRPGVGGGVGGGLGQMCNTACVNFRCITSDARSLLGPAPVGASLRQCNWLWRLVSPIRCLVACIGSNCLPTGSWWPVTAPNLNVAARKFQNVLKFSSRHLHRAISAKCPPSGTKWRDHIALWRKQSAYWNPLECNGARQVAPMRFRATWRHLAPSGAPNVQWREPNGTRLVTTSRQMPPGCPPFGATCRLSKL